MSRNVSNSSPKRQRRANQCAQKEYKPPSFKLTGLIVLSAVVIMLFGFSPHAGASTEGPIEQFITGLGQAINNVTNELANHF